MDGVTTIIVLPLDNVVKFLQMVEMTAQCSLCISWVHVVPEVAWRYIVNCDTEVKAANLWDRLQDVVESRQKFVARTRSVCLEEQMQ